MGNYVFKENQKFNRFWLWIPVGTVTLLVIGLGLLALEKPVSWTDKIIPILILGAVLLFFLSIRIEIRIDGNSLQYKYPPIINNWRKYRFEDMEQIEIKKYKSFWEFGGWGIRYNFDYWLYNTGGKYGLLVTTKKKKFMLGTYKPQEAQIAIDQFREFKSGNNAH
ncbi:MAG: hypothetical protein EA341_17590 [Mongoliibacter sp.]|uniref:hypothetical protein n=1 Tax=Mongoliibacter sp. TaxID=2022438 RepID=UPI0012EFEFFD|nr:hypothetical protein [Mongoliibacter sp.]TVP43717.1 MAG: hypothetical protein EA341_17590 [Mongoliibacter sp.]